MSRFNGSQIVPSRGENEEELCSDLKSILQSFFFQAIEIHL
jgi:hypothetical protein